MFDSSPIASPQPGQAPPRMPSSPPEAAPTRSALKNRKQRPRKKKAKQQRKDKAAAEAQAQQLAQQRQRQESLQQESSPSLPQRHSPEERPQLRQPQAHGKRKRVSTPETHVSQSVIGESTPENHRRRLLEVVHSAELDVTAKHYSSDELDDYIRSPAYKTNIPNTSDWRFIDGAAFKDHLSPSFCTAKLLVAPVGGPSRRIVRQDNQPMLQHPRVALERNTGKRELITRAPLVSSTPQPRITARALEVIDLQPQAL